MTADEDALVPEDRPTPKINTDPDVWGDLERRFENVLEVGHLTMFAIPEDAEVQHLGGRFYTVIRKATNRKETDVDDKNTDENRSQVRPTPTFVRRNKPPLEERLKELRANLKEDIRQAGETVNNSRGKAHFPEP